MKTKVHNSLIKNQFFA